MMSSRWRECVCVVVVVWFACFNDGSSSSAVANKMALMCRGVARTTFTRERKGKKKIRLTPPQPLYTKQNLCRRFGFLVVNVNGALYTERHFY